MVWGFIHYLKLVLNCFFLFRHALTLKKKSADLTIFQSGLPQPLHIIESLRISVHSIMCRFLLFFSFRGGSSTGKLSKICLCPEEQLQIKVFSSYPPNILIFFFTFIGIFMALYFCVRTQGEENEQKMHTNTKTTVS